MTILKIRLDLHNKTLPVTHSFSQSFTSSARYFGAYMPNIIYYMVRNMRPGLNPCLHRFTVLVHVNDEIYHKETGEI